MLYVYEDFVVQDATNSYVVTYYDERIRINKDLIKDFDDSEPEMIAIVYAFVELTRLDAKEIHKNCQKKIINKPEFKERLKILLETRSIEELIVEIQSLKYHEMIDYFM